MSDSLVRRRLAYLLSMPVVIGTLWTAPSSVEAALYLDGNGAVAGSGVTTPLTWDAGTNWSTDSTGSIATVGWTDGQQAVFSAGADRVGATSVTIAGTVNPLGILTEEGSPTISGGTINLGGDTVQVNTGTTTIQSLISGAGGINKTGAGVLVLASTGSNSYSGTLTVSQGTVGVAGTAGDGTVRGNVDILSGATLRLDVSNRIINTSIINVNAGATFNRNGQGDAIGGLAGGGSIIGGGVLELDFQSGVISTFSGSMTGAGLNVRGENQNGTIAKQVLTGTLNTSGGALNIRRGNSANDNVILELAGNGTSTVGTVVIGLSGTGTATLSVVGNHILNATNFSIGDQNTHPGTVNQSGGTVNVSGVIRLGHWPNETSAYNLSAGNLNLTGVPGAIVNQAGVAEQNGVIYLGIDGTGNFSISGGAASAAAMVLDGRGNTAGTDTFTLTGGSLFLGTANIAHSGIFSGALNANTSYQINLGGGTLGANQNWNSALNMTLTGTNGNTTFNTNGRNINLSGILGGSGGLNKSGAGVLTLTNANSYAGATIVNGGTLNVMGSLAGGNVTVNNTATLGGEGTIGGPTTSLLGSIIAPGNGPGDIGTLTFGSSLDIGGTLLIDINGTGPGSADLINVAGLLDISGAILDFDLVNTINDPFYIFASYGSLTGQFASITGAPAAGYEVKYNFMGNNIALVQIPEPATMSLLGLASLAMLRRRRVIEG